MPGVQYNRRRKKIKHRGAAYIFVSVILIAAAVWLSMRLFFRINRVEVNGCTVYGESVMTNASGISKGESPFFIDKSGIIGNIYDNFPYVAEVSLVYRLPGTMVIEIKERQALGMVFQGNVCWLIDGDGYLLEQTSERSTKGLPLVRGLTLIGPAAGRPADVPEEEGDRLSALLTLLREFERNHLLSDVAQADISQPHQLRFTYQDGQYQVLLGDVADLEIKLPFLLAAVRELPVGARGTVDVSRAAEQRKASFIPSTGIDLAEIVENHTMSIDR